jgi:SAM-dependent methyltransferase
MQKKHQWKCEGDEMNDIWYREIIVHYEKCLARYGATAKGMDWPNAKDLFTRFDIMLGVINQTDRENTVIDLGCGAGFLVDHIEHKDFNNKIKYLGIDASAKMIGCAKRRHPGRDFEVRDILKNPLPYGSIDYLIMNGVLTEKRGLTHEQMEDYAKTLIHSAYKTCRIAIAFNVMSAHVDWKRDDLFHWPLDSAVAFMASKCSKDIMIRMDYGLYEYTVYLYRRGFK